MKVMQRLSSVLAGSAVVAVAAFGGTGLAKADGYERQARVAYDSPTNWSGFYFGVHSGWVWSGSSAFFPDGNPAATIVGVAGQGYSTNHDAPLVGGQIGLQHQFGQIVLGVEATVSSAFQDNPGSALCPKQTIALFNCTGRFDDVATVGGRVGLALGKWMPYLTGGVASAGFSNEARNLSLAPGATTIVRWEKGRYEGWYIGGGVDWAISGGWTVGIDYRHYDFSSNLEPASAVIGGVWGALPNDNASFSPTADTVTLRVSWKFGRDQCCAPLK
jgi:opacity protein-like surface antigen